MKIYAIVLLLFFVSFQASAQRGPAGSFDLDEVECVFIDLETVECAGKAHSALKDSLTGLLLDMTEIENYLKGKDPKGEKIVCRIVEDHISHYPNGDFRFRIQRVSCANVEYQYYQHHTETPKEAPTPSLDSGSGEEDASRARGY